MRKWDLRRQMAAGGLVIGLMLGLTLGFGGGWYQFRPRAANPLPVAVAAAPENEVRIRGVIAGDVTRLVLTDGRTVVADGFKTDSMGIKYRSGGTWYAQVK